MWKKLKQQFSQKPKQVFYTVKVNLSYNTPFSNNCNDFVCDFWGAKGLKRDITLILLENLQSTS